MHPDEWGIAFVIFSLFRNKLLLLYGSNNTGHANVALKIAEAEDSASA